MKNFLFPAQAKYLGYRPEDYTTPYAGYFTPEMAPLPVHVTAALAQSPWPAGTLPARDAAPQLAEAGYQAVETGFALESDGAATVAVQTLMPRVTPAMWDWWFGWHGSQDNRYKLWHPQAHQSAQWQDGQDTPAAYIGRTSLVEEYIGPNLAQAAIQFVAASEMGFTAPAQPAQEVFICARLGYPKLPLDFGWLLHQVRATADGAEMRSRFWLGGQYIGFRVAGGGPRWAAHGLARANRMRAQQARDLLVHCAAEMNHLAAFLPELYAEFKS